MSAFIFRSNVHAKNTENHSNERNYDQHAVADDHIPSVEPCRVACEYLEIYGDDKDEGQINASKGQKRNFILDLRC